VVGRARGAAVTRVASRPALAAALCASVLALAARSSLAAPGLEQIQKEFKNALEKGTPATVTVTAKDSIQGCSGVMVTSRGLVLSDFDAGVVLKRGAKEPGWSDAVKVRVPDMKTGAFVEYEARIVKVLKDLDSTLIQIVKPPDAGFRHLVPASADDLHIGSYTFVAGNSFGMSSESLPAMTAGVVAATKHTPRDDTSDSGRFRFLYTAAAVAPGVSGGPVLDAQGRLVGIVSGYEPVMDDNPYQFLGKVMPVDRLRAGYRTVPEAKDVFDTKAPRFDAAKVPDTTALETVLAKVAADTYPSVASLVLERSAPLNSLTSGSKGPVVLPRYVGPASAVAVSDDGWLVTSLYNLTNVLGMFSVSVSLGLPAPAKVATGLGSITKFTACFPDGASGEAKLVAIHEGLGIAVLKAEVAGRRPVPPAAPSAYAPGRFLVPVANPFGAAREPDPLMNFGVVSKRHPDDIADPWRGQIQTDAGGTDGNCGAPVVDLEGRLVGVMTLWLPIQHGRNSGVAFVVPWDRIEKDLPAMREGRNFKLPRIGVEWPRDGATVPKIGAVAKDGPAEKAGLLAGDVVLKIGDLAVKSVGECTKSFVGRYAGDRVAITVLRDGKAIVLDVELGTRD
jgi:S1-C subfamily serine protease